MVLAVDHGLHGQASTDVVWTSRHRGLSHLSGTRNAEAQRLFDQGLLLTYAFNHAAAIAAFERAAVLDPDFALAHWGVALAHGANINAPLTPERTALARAAIERASALAARAPERDRAYIAAMRLRYPQPMPSSSDTPPDRAPIERRYVDAMRALAARYSDDPDAATLYADALMNLSPWRYWTADGQPTPGTPEILAALEAAMRVDPEHLGANHYYIHAVEASPHPERALPSALRMDALKLDTGHLAHMSSHIHLRLGDYDAVVRANAHAVAADKAFLAASGSGDRSYLGYVAHNLEFLAMGHTYRGDLAGALQAVDLFEAAIDDIARRAPRVEYKYAVRPAVLLRFERWDEILALPDPGATRPYTRAFFRYARGVARAARGDRRRAAREQAAFRWLRRKVPADLSLGQNTATTVLDIAGRVLAARIAMAKGETEDALRTLRTAVAAQDALAYDEPPNWDYPIRETLGTFLLRSGDAAQAEAVFRDDLRRHPRNPRSLRGLAASLRALGRDDEAALVEQQVGRVCVGAGSAEAASAAAQASDDTEHRRRAQGAPHYAIPSAATAASVSPESTTP